MISRIKLGCSALVLEPWALKKQAKPPPEADWSPYVGSRSTTKPRFSWWSRWRMKQANRHLNTLALRALGLVAEDKVLEVGYGPGDALRRAAKVTTHGLTAGIDRAMEMLHSAAKRTRGARSNVSVLRGDVSWLPWSTGYFDKAFCVDGITEWPCTRSGLEELHRVLIPGGELVIVEHISQKMTHAKAVALAHVLSAVGFYDLEVMLVPNLRGEALILRAVRF